MLCIVASMFGGHIEGILAALNISHNGPEEHAF